VNVCLGFPGNKLIRSIIFDPHITGNIYVMFLRNELPGLSQDSMLIMSHVMFF
jgi:hypothetical protein